MSAARPAPLITVRELAELLGWKLTRTYEADRREDIPGRVVVNGRILYRRRVVEAWLDGADLPAGASPANFLNAPSTATTRASGQEGRG